MDPTMDSTMEMLKPLAADEMFPEAGYMDIEESGSAVAMDISSDKHVHEDFYNDFEDLFDDEPFEI